MQYKGLRRRIAKTVAAGLVASLYLGWGSQLFAAPVITNMPHRADGTRITGSQPVPKEMPRDVAVKTKPATPKPATPPTQAAPKGETPKPATPKPATPPTQAAPKAETPKPATPKPATPPTQAAPKGETPKPATPKPATPPAQAAPKAETPKPATPKPATPPTQAAPKAETPKPVTPKPATPPTQAAPKTEAPKPATPKPAVKPATSKLPTKPPGLETKKPDSVKPATPAKTTKAKKPAKPEQVKAVYKVGDKGWKVKQAQQYLQKLGFDPGETSGQFTKATRKALRKFQKKYKLKETGNLDNATYEELKWQAEAKEYGGNVASTKILKTAAQYKGVPYVFGGTTPRGFDCSGYVQYVFAKHGIRLTRTADTQAREGKFVSRKNLKPGDLVFFTTYEPGASHVGSNLTDSYWGPRYYTARRILTGNDRSR